MPTDYVAFQVLEGHHTCSVRRMGGGGGGKEGGPQDAKIKPNHPMQQMRLLLAYAVVQGLQDVVGSAEGICYSWRTCHDGTLFGHVAGMPDLATDVS